MTDHDTIETTSRVEHYVTGRLSEGEALVFEEHLLDCPACLEKVEAAERLQRGLAAVVAEDAATLGVVTTAAVLARRRWRGVWALAFLVLVGGLGFWLVDRGDETLRLRHELELAQAALQQSSARGSEADELEQRLADAEAALAAASDERQSLAETLERWKTPAANLPIALLTPLRGADDAFAVDLPRDGRWIGLWIELGGEEFNRYHAELINPEGQRVWVGDDLQFNTLGALFVQLPAELLHPGRWTLEVAGVAEGGGRPMPLATFPLAVRAP